MSARGPAFLSSLGVALALWAFGCANVQPTSVRAVPDAAAARVAILVGEDNDATRTTIDAIVPVSPAPP